MKIATAALVALLLAFSPFTLAQTGNDIYVLAGACSDASSCIPDGQSQASYIPAGGGGDMAVVVAMRALGRVLYDFGADPSQFDASTGTGLADCSSFVQGVVKEAYGTRIPRTARFQYRATVPVPLGSQRPGDLIFFKNTYNAFDARTNPDNISHVGIVVDGCRFIHAGNPVKIGSYCSGKWVPGGRHFHSIGRVPSPLLNA